HRQLALVPCDLLYRVPSILAMEWLTVCRPARWRAALTEFRDRASWLFEVDDQLCLVGCPIGPSASRCCPYRGLQRRWTCPIGAVIGGPGPKEPSLLKVAAQGGVHRSEGVDEP